MKSDIEKKNRKKHQADYPKSTNQTSAGEKEREREKTRKEKGKRERTRP